LTGVLPDEVPYYDLEKSDGGSYKLVALSDRELFLIEIDV
jgi:hypothetical protein